MKKDVIYIKNDFYNCYFTWRGYHNWFRNPRTFNEIKQNCWAKDDGLVIRGKRNKLPTNYDDLLFSYPYGKSWKRFTKKKKQWM